MVTYTLGYVVVSLLTHRVCGCLFIWSLARFSAIGGALVGIAGLGMQQGRIG